MNIILVASIIVLLTIVVGVLLALLFVNAGNVVAANQVVVEKEKSGYNPRLTAGHKIMPQADASTQIAQAQALAAQRAAMLPRGANMGIRPKPDAAEVRTPAASDGVEKDPLTATKIAMFHTWNGLQYKQAKPAPAGAPTAVARPAAAKPAGPPELRPGIDYPVIEITDSMSPEEKRKATIANSKAKSAAMKAAKASGMGTVGAEVEVEGAPVAAAAPAAAAPVAAGGTVEPIAGVHYEEIPITDGMSPDEVRKARIANSKAKSAAAKALKASGAMMAVPQPAAEPVAAAPAPVAAAPTPAVESAIPKPDLIEINDSMSPDEIRRARIENSKRTSAYNKALKAAGIDPATVK